MITLLFTRLLHLRESAGTWEDACVSLFLVIFGGLMSGLTLGLMSLDLVELEVLQRSGTPAEQKQAVAVLPVVKKQHQLLVTLLLCNAIAMEALPVFLDNMVSTLVAVLLSVTFVLAFGEVIPQAICSRNGLAIGANLGWLVRILMLICFPIAYPVGKLLDLVLGHSTAGIFKRSQLKAFVSIHSKEEGKGGDLSHDEITIIKGALDLTLKTVKEAMTPIESTFSVSVDSKLDWETLGRILATGHSRVPVYSGDPKNLIGILLVKSLISMRAEDLMPVSSVSIRKLPRVPADTPLYDMLNEFQKGQSHMAAVVSAADGKSVQTSENCNNSIASGDYHNHLSDGCDNVKASPEYCPTCTKDGKSAIKAGPDDCDNVKALPEYCPTYTKDGKSAIKAGPVKNCPDWKVDFSDDSPQACSKLDDTNSGTEARRQKTEGGEIIGIITLEDVFEELIQEEIVDETDEYVDVQRRIRVTTGSLPLSSPHNGATGQHGGYGILTNDRHVSVPSAKPGGKVSSKPSKFSFLKAVHNLKEPLLDKT